jgi:YHS domain-containing protein
MIFKLLIGIVVLYLLYKLIHRAAPAVGARKRPEGIRTPEGGEELVEDPQCHAYVPVSQAVVAQIDGKKVHFCSRKCLEAYRKAG